MDELNGFSGSRKEDGARAGSVRFLPTSTTASEPTPLRFNHLQQLTPVASLEGLSMRAVAGELEIGTMSLYRYVTDRDQLEALVVERVLARMDFTLAPRLRWDKRIRTLLERMRATIAEHPALIPLVVSRRHLERSSLQLGEALLQALSEAGLSGKRSVIALRSLLSYTIGALQFQHLGPLAGPGTDQITRLPEAEYPLLAETARNAQQVSSLEEFSGGLELLLRGLQRD